MTDLERAFLADIAAHPQDDFPRLAYADWLEEHGKSERAEFIRAQCELAKYPQQVEWLRNMPVEQWTGSPEEGKMLRRLDVLRRRERELWGGFVFIPPMPHGCRSVLQWDNRGENQCLVHRGFVSSITLTTDAFLTHAADIIEAVPMLEEVRWSDARPWSFAPENPERSAWWYGLRHNSPHDVPDAIWKHLRGKKTFIMGYVWVCVYDAEDGSLADELAHVDLSQACLTFAREQLAARRNFRPGIVAATTH